MEFVLCPHLLCPDAWPLRCPANPVEVEDCIITTVTWPDRVSELIRWDDSLYLWHDSVFLHLLLIPVDINSIYMSGKTMGLISTHVGWQQQPGMSLKSDLLCYSEAVNNLTLRFMSLISVVTVFHSNCFSLKATKLNKTAQTDAFQFWIGATWTFTQSSIKTFKTEAELSFTI